MTTLDVAAMELLIEADQGSLFELPCVVTNDADGSPVDLTGYGIRMQVRTEYGAADPITGLDLSIGSGIAYGAVIDGVTLAKTDGAFTVTVDATVMAAVAPSEGGGYVHDLELVPGDDDAQAFKLFRGRFKVKPEATT